MSAARTLRPRRTGPLAASLAALLLSSGCATLGGNIAGDFSCKAPDGICAPSSTIDDRALAMISGEAGDIVIPAGPYSTPAASPRATRTAAAQPVRGGAPASAPRTREKVLRIVFQPYIDDRGRLHEASAVHAVVEGEWQAQALADATPIPDRASAAPPSEVRLADAVDRDAGRADLGLIDPNLPDPAEVAAARARAPDPVSGIKADVAERLARRPRGGAGRRSPTPMRSAPAAGAADPVGAARLPAPAAGTSIIGSLSSGPRPQVGAPVRPPQRAGTVPAAPAPAPDAAAATAIPTDARSAAEAVATVKASGLFGQARTQVEAGARDAATAASRTPAGPAMRATGFPATVPEDN